MEPGRSAASFRATLCVVGLGDIGRTIARPARAFGMRVLGVSQSGRKVAEAERVYRVRDLKTALAGADFVVLTVPLTETTRGLIGPAELAAMKPSAWLVNVARGAIVDEAALLEALWANRLGGAVLDVFAEEPLPSGHPLWEFDNVVITPHISGRARPARSRLSSTTTSDAISPGVLSGFSSTGSAGTRTRARYGACLAMSFTRKSARRFFCQHASPMARQASSLSPSPTSTMRSAETRAPPGSP